MPEYDFFCPKCETRFSEFKTIGEYCSNSEAKCPCGFVCNSTHRDFSLTKTHFIGTAVQSAEYNPGLGCVVKNKYHRSEICKQKGLVEVGNDFGAGEKQQTHFEKRKKEELDKAWEDKGDLFL